MRFATITKILGVALLVGAALGASPALADDGCLQACADQYAIDRQACLDAYNQALADLQAQEEACLALPPDQQPACLKGVEHGRTAAKNQYKQCLNKAKSNYNKCANNCPPVSPCTP